MGNFKDLTGNRIGKLLVIDRAENIGKNVAWNCVCDCGNHIVVKGVNLYRKDNPTVSCGCDKRRIKHDLKGKRFGRLYVIGLSSDNEKSIIDGRRRWKCQCDCGNTTYVLGANLINGNTKGCGCLAGKNLLNQSNLRDLTGKKFGRLTVLERDKDIIYHNRSMAVQWKCRCDCGKIVTKTSAGLIKGYSKSCGCLKNEIGNNPFKFEIGQCVETKYGKFIIKDRFRKKRELNKTKDKKYICKCMNCGEEIVILEGTLVNGIGSCRACSDSRSFGERFFYWFLKQCNVEFETEYSPIWAERIRYDFYFEKDGIKYIVEVDGAQHYKRYKYQNYSIDETLEIDREKEKLARNNNHFVIRINCKNSKGKYFVNSIKSSELSKIFNLNEIDWDKCFYMAISSKMRNVCNLWNCGYNSTEKISEIVGMSANYISKMLIECADFGICDYDPMEEQTKGRRKKLKNSKKIICTNNAMIFQGAEECSRESEELFGVHLIAGGITRVCRKERKCYKGFHFEYI